MSNRYALISAVSLVALAFVSDAETREWDFESDATDWHSPVGGAIVVEPGVADNHAYQIVATQPHHTRLVLEGSGNTPDFVLTFRVKVLEWEGAPPGVYAYGRMGGGGFLALQLGRGDGRLFCYYGQDTPSVSLGGLDVGFTDKPAWVRVAFACFGDYAFAKAWPTGSPEPGWQVEGRDPEALKGQLALGVWTSPREPSRATVLFDDVHFIPLQPDDLDEWRLRPGPRPQLDATTLPNEDGVFEAPGRAGIATASCALAFDTTTGEITNFVDRTTGREFVAREPKWPLFRLTLTKPYGDQRVTLTSREFGAVRTSVEADGALCLSFPKHKTYGVGVRVTASGGEDEEIRLGLTVSSDSDWCVASALFPDMPSPASLGEEDADDALLLPWASGAVLPSPGQRTVWRSADYPGAAFAQFCALYDNTAGMYVGLEDSEGHCKRYLLRTAKEQFVALNVEHLFPEIPGETVHLPYDVVLRTFLGDWRDAAAIYKAWAEEQPWCAKKLSERDEVPQFLKDGAGIIITGIQNQAGREERFGPRLEKLPDLMDAYRERTGLKHMVFVPYGWENRGTWAGINYLPAVPSNDIWQEANAALAARGHRTAFLTSGFWWVVKRQQTSNGPAFDDTEDFERRKAMCIERADGTPWIVDNYEKLKEHGSWRGLSAKLCHGSPEARDAMKAVFLETAALGVPLVSFDQEIGGGQSAPCYSADHGHPPGYGNWMWTDFRDLCAEILEEGKPVQPEFGLFLENVSELAIPYMSTYWSRQFGEVDVGVSGGRGIGLFSYLYHEYVTAIGAACVQGQGERTTRPSAGLRCQVLANNLVRGLIPGPFMHHVPLDTDEEWEELVSRAYFSYCRPYKHFPEYLMLGKTVRPLPVECDTTEVTFWRRDGKNGTPRKKGGPPLVEVKLEMPAVATGSFEAEDGSVATFLVNVTAEVQTLTVRLPESREVAVFSSDRSVGSDRLDGGDGSGRAPGAQERSLPLSLGPFDVRVVLMR